MQYFVKIMPVALSATGITNINIKTG